MEWVVEMGDVLFEGDDVEMETRRVLGYRKEVEEEAKMRPKWGGQEEISKIF